MLEFSEVTKKTTVYGERIKAIREALGMSRLRLSELSDVGTTTLSSIEMSGQDAQVSTLERIANCLGVSLEELMSSDGDHKPVSLLLSEVIRELASLNNGQLRELLPILQDTIKDFTGPGSADPKAVSEPKRGRRKAGE